MRALLVLLLAAAVFVCTCYDEEKTPRVLWFKIGYCCDTF
jgi:hypothetical protein